MVKSFQARSSVWLERYLDTVEVNGSSPFGPTKINNLQIVEIYPLPVALRASVTLVEPA